MKITKDTGVSIGALAIVLPLAFLFFTSKADTKKVEKIEIEVDEQENRIEENEKVDMRQTILMDNMAATLERVNKRLEN